MRAAKNSTPRTQPATQSNGLSEERELTLRVAAILATGQADMVRAAIATLGALLNGAVALRRTRLNGTCAADTQEIIDRVASTVPARSRRPASQVVEITAGLDAMELGRQWYARTVRECPTD